MQHLKLKKKITNTQQYVTESFKTWFHFSIPIISYIVFWYSKLHFYPVNFYKAEFAMQGCEKYQKTVMVS